MILKKVKCIGIGPAMTPEGKRKTQITFGRDLDPMKHSTPQGVPIHYDNEIIVFLDEDAFKTVKRKFIVGEEFNFTVSDKGIEIK
jgi:hypothetical protein